MNDVVLVAGIIEVIVAVGMILICVAMIEYQASNARHIKEEYEIIEKRNALIREFTAELVKASDDIRKKQEQKVVIIRNSGVVKPRGCDPYTLDYPND